jgi:hypothetical protein
MKKTKDTIVGITTEGYNSIFFTPPKFNFQWYVSEDLVFSSNVKYTWYNRFKWWVSTKLFLPGRYKWIKGD